MGKYSNSQKLSKAAQEDLFIEFAKTISKLKNPVEAASFIRDLLSEQEVLMLARRLQIARLLESGLTYEQIEKTAKVGSNTIAKVHFWLSQYGEGYRTVLARNEKRQSSEPASSLSWRSIKRKYPMYFWPELVLKEIIASANKKERARLISVVNSLRQKTKLSEQLLAILK